MCGEGEVVKCKERQKGGKERGGKREREGGYGEGEREGRRRGGRREREGGE